MARGRMISSMVSTDKRFNALSTEAALVFLMTVPHLDRDGLILADACILAGKVCPRRPQLSLIMDSIIDEWISLGMVIAYECEDGTILFFTGFAKNQVGMRYDREPKSVLPVPPGYKRTETGLEPTEAQPSTDTIPPSNGTVPPSSGNLPATIRQPAVNLPPERNRSRKEEEAEEEVEVEAHAREEPASPAATADSDTARVWAKWNANMPGVKTQVIVDAVNELLTEYSAWEIEEAITIACKRNKRYLSYVQGILAKGVGSPPPQGGNGHVPAIKADRTSQAFANVRRELEERGILQ